MRELISSVSKLSISTILNLLSSVLKNKILALIVGPVGIGIYSQVMNLTFLVSSVFPIGSIGLISNISSLYENKKYTEIASVILYFFKHNLILSVIVTIIFLLFHSYIGHLVFASADFDIFIILFAVFIPFNLLLSFIDLYLKGIRVINQYVKFLSINIIASTLLTIPLIYFWSVHGAVIGLMISALLSIFTGIWIIRKNKLGLNFKSTILPSRKTVSSIYKLGFAALLTMVLQNITILVIKSVIANKLDLGDVGIFQSVYSISSAYFGIFFILIGSYSIPKVSTIKDNTELTNELNNTIKFLLLIYTPLILIIFTLRTFIIGVLYTDDFLAAKNLLIYQLPAEFIRAMSWVTGLWLIPNVKVKQWIIFDTFYCLSFLSVFYMLIHNGFGVKSASIAYLAAYAAYFLINFAYAYRSINFRFSFDNLKLTVITLIISFLIFFLSVYDESMAIYLLLPALGIWGMLSVRKSDLIKINEIVRNKLNNKY